MRLSALMQTYPLNVATHYIPIELWEWALSIYIGAPQKQYVQAH